jgi:hypothetical protein
MPAPNQPAMTPRIVVTEPEDEGKSWMTGLAQGVTQTIMSRRYKFDCTLGARLLRDLIRTEGGTAEAVGSVLVVADPQATTTEGQRGGILKVGRTGRPANNGEFDGHVVVRAEVDGAQFLLDPTIGQLLNNPITRDLGKHLFVLVLRLRQDWPSPDRADVSIPIGGWSLLYHHDPDLDWSGHGGWNHPDVAELVAEARVAAADGSPEFENLMRRRIGAEAFRGTGRNDPCPVCGSGKKFKHCCGR